MRDCIDSPLPVSATTVIIFAKAPVPGLVKTRLIPALGAAGAAALAQLMLENALHVATDANVGPVQLHCAPDEEYPALQAAAMRAGAICLAQGTGDLGERMTHALTAALAVSFRAILIGTDCPALDNGVLCDADASLAAGAGAVFVPTVDGGFALAGFRREALGAIAGVFAGIAWSTPAVMHSVRKELLRAGLRWNELSTLVDVDDPAVLEHIPAEWLEQLRGEMTIAGKRQS